jgi:hypothetical protein
MPPTPDHALRTGPAPARQPVRLPGAEEAQQKWLNWGVPEMREAARPEEREGFLTNLEKVG